MSSKFLSKSLLQDCDKLKVLFHDLVQLASLLTPQFLSSFRFQCFRLSFVLIVGLSVAYGLIRGFNASIAFYLKKK
jgi:hypothetical protein